jgi:hypothetical protein
MRVRPPEQVGEQFVTPAGHEPFTAAYPDWADVPDAVGKQLAEQGWETDAPKGDNKRAARRGRED